ncbi:MAG: DUF5519 family protein [Candidatus Accumulibacter sp.]|uniref:luciferase domain-containing protein n=1 Tax=Accumulibacter sp. TaxID=2053492 RepID=UPI00287A2D5D|nr:luciferase family protein [Accumulibacter sp.]MDS4015417.1 DUF5519 family protein [Accumulibacter sp.]
MPSPEDYLSALKALAPRAGLPARMSANIPQEQLDQFPPDWGVIEQLAAYAFALPEVVERPTQIAPDGSRALHLADGVPANREAFLVGREFAHIHNPPIGSMHAMLPEPFRGLAIDQGWVVRHPFAIRGSGPQGAVFIYAPRDAGELEWAKLLLAIAHAWACGRLSAN